MQTKTTAKDFFLYLSGFATLYVSVISLVSLLFAVINRVLPDIAPNGYTSSFYSGPIRLAIASLLIVFPIYLVVSVYLDKYVRKNIEKKDLAVRKWLTYLTLFLTAAAMIVDLIVLVNTFLEGEISSRFIWKMLSVLVVSGGVFFYYFYDLKKTFAPDEKRHTRLLVTIASVVVLGSLVWGFVAVGSPNKARAMKFDERRVNDLSSIQWQIISYWQSKGEIPEDVSQLNDSISGWKTPVDPETGKAYKYQKLGTIKFSLCANFKEASTEDKARSTYYIESPEDNWKHGAGETCFERNIDADRYPIFEKTLAAPAKRAY